MTCCRNFSNSMQYSFNNIPFLSAWMLWFVCQMKKKVCARGVFHSCLFICISNLKLQEEKTHTKLVTLSFTETSAPLETWDFTGVWIDEQPVILLIYIHEINRRVTFPSHFTLPFPFVCGLIGVLVVPSFSAVAQHKHPTGELVPPTVQPLKQCIS